MGLRDVGKRILDLGVDLGDPKSIWKILSVNLEFPLRDKNEETDIKNKKDKKKATQLDIHRIRKIETQEQIDKILFKSQVVHSEIEVNNTKRKKITQILFYGKIIPRNDCCDFTLLLKQLYESGLGGRRIVQVLNTVLDTIYTDNKIKINSKEVSDWSQLKAAE